MKKNKENKTIWKTEQKVLCKKKKDVGVGGCGMNVTKIQYKYRYIF